MAAEGRELGADGRGEGLGARGEQPSWARVSDHALRDDRMSGCAAHGALRAGLETCGPGVGEVWRPAPNSRSLATVRWRSPTEQTV
jgi:hypothetical protein